MPRTLAALALSALALALPAAADAKTRRGKTSQGRRVSLTLGANGVPTRVRIVWRVPCRRKPGTSSPGTTVGTPPFDHASASALRDHGTYRQHWSGGLSARITGTLRGHRSGAGWTGTFSVVKRFSRHGKSIDRCAAKGIGWSVG